MKRCPSTTRCARRLSVEWFAILLLVPTPVFGQGLVDGFNKGQGHLDLAISYSWERYDEFYVGSTRVSEPALGEITTQSVSLYGIYGLSSRIDLIVNLPYISAKSSSNSALNESSLQDLAVCLKGRLVRHSYSNGATLTLLGSIGAAVPTTRYAIEAPVAIGHRTSHIEGRVIGQFEPGNGVFAAVQTGYIWRSDVTIVGQPVDVPHAFDTIVRAGYGHRLFYADVWANVQKSRKGTDIGPGIPFPSNAISFFRLGSSVYAPLGDRFGVGIGTGYTVSGENVGKAIRISGGIVYRTTR